ncbi:MAG: hypothetical protein SGI88_03835 [Candidatus Hydrogenedentes bacterium]|nr:hypothetical protein [Candidatus Hydrogenedentota bacterium]
MSNVYLFDLDAYNKARRRRYVVRQTRLSRHPGIEQALMRLKQTIDTQPREKAQGGSARR